MKSIQFVDAGIGTVQVIGYIIRDGLSVQRLVLNDGRLRKEWCIMHLARRCLFMDIYFRKRADAFRFVRSLPEAPWSAPDVENIPDAVRAEVITLADAYVRSGAALPLNV